MEEHALSLHGAAEDEYDENDEREESTEIAVFGGVHSRSAMTYMNLASTELQTHAKDESVAAFISMVQADVAKFGVHCPIEVVRGIVIMELQKKTKSTYVHVTTSKSLIAQMAGKHEKAHKGLQYDEKELQKLATQINDHLSDLLQKGFTDLLQTDNFLRTMKYHEVEFLENMVKYVDHSKNIKKASMEMLESQITKSFWTITWQTEKGGKAAERMRKAAFMAE